MKIKQIVTLGLVACMMLGAVSGCGNKPVETDGKVTLSISNWPDETSPESLENMNKRKDTFLESHPDINIVTDTYNYDTKTFTMKASAGQLPTLYSTWFTEIQQIINAGYAADITEAMEENGYIEAMNPLMLDFLKDENGRIFGIATDAYAQGLYINKKLFKEAGLVNEDGSVKVPNSYLEVAEFSKIIKEKTGKAGFIVPTTDNFGGWIFLNIAWSYGVNFMEQDADGKWIATFDTPEMREALQYIKDLKWEYDALVADKVIDAQTMWKYFAVDQGAMMISNPPTNPLTQTYDMAIEDIFVTRVPEGPKGRFSQMGGNVRMFAPNATKEQIQAGLEWLRFEGNSPTVTDEQLANLEVTLQNTLSENGIVLDQSAFSIWMDEESDAKRHEIISKYTNVDHKDYEQYYAFEDVEIRAEPAACAQQLYAILDGCLQEVISNENADIDKLVTTANNDFQVNHLDKMD